MSKWAEHPAGGLRGGTPLRRKKKKKKKKMFVGVLVKMCVAQIMFLEYSSSHQGLSHYYLRPQRDESLKKLYIYS